MRRPIRRIANLLAIAALTLALGACGSSDNTSAMAGDKTSATAGSATITIKNFSFGMPVSAEVGSTVTVKNMDTTAHTVTADDMSFDTGSIAAGATATFTVKKAGAVKFHCDIHNYMTGTIQVSG